MPVLVQASKLPRDYEVITAAMRKVFATRREGQSSCTLDLSYFAKRGILFTRSIVVDQLRNRHGYKVTGSGDVLTIHFRSAAAIAA